MSQHQNEPEFDFAEWLKEFGHGAVNKQLGEKLREVIIACASTGKKGGVTLKIAAASLGGIAELRASVTVTKPEPALPGGSYYTTEKGVLVSDDPRQLKLPARVLDQPKIININEGK